MPQEVTKHDREIVSALRKALAELLGADRFALWFGAGEGLQYVDGTLVVSAPDRFSLDHLRGRFCHEIGAACDAVLAQRPEIDFRVDPALAPHANNETTTDAGAIAPVPQVSRVTQMPDSNTTENGPLRRRIASLDAFVVGDGSRVAFTAAQATPSRLGAVTPLFFYGPTGCGKTHLLQGILNAVRRRHAARRAVMLSAEQFTSSFLEALQGSGLPSFRRKYRDVELLLIDDVQFFAGKRATLIELQHTIDTLLRDGRQLVLASDRPPSELAALGTELTARMAGGLVCGIEPPDSVTRRDIVRQLASERQIAMPDSVSELIAGQIAGDTRQLAGALNRLQACSQAFSKPITLGLAESALADLFRASHRVVRLTDIDRAVCDVFGLEPKALQSGRKSRGVSYPRMLAMWLARKHTRAAFSEIGQYFGRRSHSTVISAQKKVQTWQHAGETIPLANGDCHVDEAIRRLELHLRTG